MTEEEWCPIPGVPLYEASDLGRIRSWNKYAGRRRAVPKVLNSGAAGGRRLVVVIAGRQEFVHRLVCMAFHGPQPPNKPLVRHLDGNHLNNVPSNLAWGTQKENVADSIAHGTRARGERMKVSWLKDEDVLEIRRLYSEGWSFRGIARAVGIAHPNVRHICLRNSWAHLEEGQEFVPVGAALAVAGLIREVL